MTIWKFPFEIDDIVRIKMPRDARILSVQVQRGVACLWALVEPSNRLWTKRIVVRGTGHQVAGFVGEFIGTVQLMGGDLVFHVFDDGWDEGGGA